MAPLPKWASILNLGGPSPPALLGPEDGPAPDDAAPVAPFSPPRDTTSPPPEVVKWRCQQKAADHTSAPVAVTRVEGKPVQRHCREQHGQNSFVWVLVWAWDLLLSWEVVDDSPCPEDLPPLRSAQTRLVRLPLGGDIKQTVSQGGTDSGDPIHTYTVFRVRAQHNTPF